MVAARLQQMVGDYSGRHWGNRDPQRGLDPPATERLREITEEDWLGGLRERFADDGCAVDDGVLANA